MIEKEKGSKLITNADKKKDFSSIRYTLSSTTPIAFIRHKAHNPDPNSPYLDK